MTRSLMAVALILVALAPAGRAAAQDSKAAAATRKKLQQKITVEAKEVGLKDFLADVNNEVTSAIRFKIDNTTGVSNNMKVAYKGKEVTVEKLLNDLADKYDFGYIVVSNAANNKEDGIVVIRKSSKGKERGYEAGKEPKKGASLDGGTVRPRARTEVAPGMRGDVAVVIRAARMRRLDS
jgi:hypothetical protein